MQSTHSVMLASKQIKTLAVTTGFGKLVYDKVFVYKNGNISPKNLTTF